MSNSKIAEPENSGFFETLFSLSFERFITLTVVKIFYAIQMAILLIGLIFVELAAIVAAVQTEDLGLAAFIMLIAPLLAFLLLIFSRVTLEVFVAIVLIAQNTQR